MANSPPSDLPVIQPVHRVIAQFLGFGFPAVQPAILVMLALVAVRQHALLGVVSGATDGSSPGAGLRLAGGIGGNFALNGLSS